MKLNTKDKNKAGIYCIRNTVNNKVYIGKSINIYFRIKQHITLLNTKSKNENCYLVNSWHKYGKDSFEYIVLEYLEVNEKLISDRELYWIRNFESNNPEKGYNLRIDSSTGMVISESTRKKLSESQTKRYANPEEVEKLKERLNKYRLDNPDWKEKMIEKLKTAKRKYTFEQYDKSMNLIKEWESIEHIILENPSYKWQNIYSVCNGYKPTMYGFIWKKKLKI